MTTVIPDQVMGEDEVFPRPTYSRHRVASTILIVNQPSGDGRTAAELDTLQEAFDYYFGSIAQRIFILTRKHSDVVKVTQAFLTTYPGPWLLIAGGGSGTQRALIQGIMNEVDRGTISLEAVQISALRLGSGNVIPRHFGLPLDPVAALRHIANDLFTWHNTPSCVYRCGWRTANRNSSSIYGMTMAGLGHFGYIPGDVERWRQHHPYLMQWFRRYWPREEINTGQYVAAGLMRALRCLLQPSYLQEVIVRQGNQADQFRLFAALLVNFDFDQLPFVTGRKLDEARLTLCLIPWRGRQQMVSALRDWCRLDDLIYRYDITPDSPVELEFSATEQTILALDEDIFIVPNRIDFSVAGMVNFVTGVLPKTAAT